ncbi:MBL fold metallo-hydrolase [Thalassospira sp. MCCC 1A01428]|uniref:MBL fold metallo-hydrolase n=1 Tax=Thalassospira sp. MCCC 1A01428 TaxID=1470575 RepID=UPI000A250015|nr:MBL fold metallo-hydrolase [Thalassospira sp. MCCC 1A01428]OSQ44776.1 beta-lactamase [Thalassospira sp. MCCC 1A01428]
MAAGIRVLSGLGEKAPACIRLDFLNRRWLLDCGDGLENEPGFDPAWLTKVNAVFISHDHVDHIGAAHYAIEAGLPIYCTAVTAKALPVGADVNILPAFGEIQVDGVTVTTGRTGHAFGGVWLHFDVGGGVLYTGDICTESDYFLYDQAPDAATILCDASYGMDNVSQRDRIDGLLGAVAGFDGQILFPVPPSGRAAEMALLFERHGLADWTMDMRCYGRVQQVLTPGGQDFVSSEAIADLRRLSLKAREFNPQAKLLLCHSPCGTRGASGDITRKWQEQGRLGQDAKVIYTGHMSETARRIVAEGKGEFHRWNVHPRLRDVVELAQNCHALQIVPLFCTRPEEFGLVEGFEGRLQLSDRFYL